MELKRDEIIKALECCTRGRKNKEDYPCDECPYNECNIVGGTSERQVKGTCQGWLMKDALSLYKELTEESQKWQKGYECVDAACRELSSKCDELTEENERLNKEVDRLSQVVLNHEGITEMEVEEAKIDTVRKMQERLKKGLLDTASLFTQQRYIVDDVIDQIAEEMLGGEK